MLYLLVQTSFVSVWEFKVICCKAVQATLGILRSTLDVVKAISSKWTVLEKS